MLPGNGQTNLALHTLNRIFGYRIRYFRSAIAK